MAGITGGILSILNNQILAYPCPYPGHWLRGARRPFSDNLHTDKLVEFLEDEHYLEVDDFNKDDFGVKGSDGEWLR